ncbi:MAG: dihydroorotate dehydrogenase electron transfer subunit [Chloroflexi bacterium]|nr:dihydroorotate dehydrogenase electron transfer subunit [Chloroflexota bacterium]
MANTCPVLSNRELTPRNYLMWLEAPQIAASARPGQFALLRCADSLERMLRRPLSVHAVDGGQVAFFYRIAGRGTAWLAAQRQRDSVDILGPLGNGFSVPDGTRRLVLIAGGLGIAPLRFLAEAEAARGRDVTLLLGARSADGLYPADLLPRDVSLALATEDGSQGYRGPVTELAARYLPQAERAFACGPEGMYRTLARALGGPNVVPVQVALEVRMGCGVGACLSCSLKTRSGWKHACVDGPVFALDDIDWEAAPVCLV